MLPHPTAITECYWIVYFTVAALPQKHFFLIQISIGRREKIGRVEKMLPSLKMMTFQNCSIFVPLIRRQIKWLAQYTVWVQFIISKTEKGLCPSDCGENHPHCFRLTSVIPGAIKMSKAAPSRNVWWRQDKVLPNWIVKGRQRVNKTYVGRLLRYLCRDTFCLCFKRKGDLKTLDGQGLPNELRQ